MPAHADWVLCFPDPDNNKDPSLLFNTFAYELHRNAGHDNGVRFRWVETFENLDLPWQTLDGVPARTTNRVVTLIDPNYATNRFYRLATPQVP